MIVMALVNAKARQDGRRSRPILNGGDGWTLSDAIIPAARSADVMISAELMQSKTGGFAALTTDLSIMRATAQL
jgi:hypothetical protein